MSAIDHVAIVGGGFSGTLQAIGLLRAGIRRITLIERRPLFGRGVAYSTSNPAHLLNVRAANMSAFPDDPDHFRRWLTARTGAAGQAFASRRDFGDYLAHLLGREIAAAPGRIALRQDAAVEADCRADGVRIGLDGGAPILADAAILAIGNLPPHDPPAIVAAGLPAGAYVTDPWGGLSGEGLTADDTVLIVGAGLSMIDAILTLEAEGFAGQVVALSRHGLLPLSHDAAAPAAGAGADRPAGGGSALVREMRGRADRVGWRAAVDGIRPHIQDLWRAATPVQQARFIRHLRPWWDIHRHRLAPEIAARLADWRASGRLTVRAGRIVGCAAAGGSIDVAWRPRGAAGQETLRVRRIVNCSGPHGDLLRTREPLVHLLLASGRVRPDRHRLGIDVNALAETIGADGRANPRLLAIGPMTRGAFWEIGSVPDIRVQTQALAQRLGGGATA